MFHIGVTDLYEGLQATAEDFVAYSHSQFGLISLLQIILLICIAGFVILYYFLLTRPYLRVHHEEKKRIAGLLSHVPNEVDINSHTRKMLRHAHNPRKAHSHAHDQDPSVQHSQQSSSSWGIPSSQG